MEAINTDDYCESALWHVLYRVELELWYIVMSSTDAVIFRVFVSASRSIPTAAILPSSTPVDLAVI